MTRSANHRRHSVVIQIKGGMSYLGQDVFSRAYNEYEIIDKNINIATGFRT